MKTLLKILVLSSPILMISQSQINGKVYLQSSGWKPVEGIFVRATDKNEKEITNGDYSKGDGAFVLKFTILKPGATIFPSIGKNKNIAIGKKGKEWELVNVKELQSISIPKNPTKELLKIIVAPKGQRNKAARKYYRIIKTNVDVKLTELENQLYKLKENLGVINQIVKEKELELEVFIKLNDSLQLYKEACQIANINLDNATERVKKYKILLNEGINIEEARKVLSTKEAYKEAKKGGESERYSIQELELVARDALVEKKIKEALDLNDSIIIIYKRNSRRTIDIVEKLLEIGKFCSGVNLNVKALDYFEKSLLFLDNANISNHELEAEIFLNIGILQKKQKKYSKAENSFLRGLKIYKSIIQDNRTKYENQIATGYNHLGNVYKEQNQLLKAKHAFEEVITIYRKKANQNPNLYGLNIARTLNQILSLESRKLFKEKKEYYKTIILEVKAYLMEFYKNNKEAQSYMIAFKRFEKKY